MEAYCIPDQKASTVADCFVDLILRFGVPKSILTDQGTNFESSLVKRVCDMLGISKLRCTAAHPQTDGETERFDRTLCETLTQYVDENQRDWDTRVPVCVSGFRFSSHSTTGYPPLELVYGRDARTTVASEVLDDGNELVCGSCREYVSALQRRLTTEHSAALDSLKNRQNRSQVPNTSDITEGDKMMLKVQPVKRGTVKKLANR